MYVDAKYDKAKDRVYVIERNKDGEREYKEFPAKYVFYYDDPNGKYKSIYGNPVTRVQCKSDKDFRREINLVNHKQLYETDTKQVFRILEEHYLGKDAPNLHSCFFDIEVDFDRDRGFSTPDDPFNPVTSISLYLQWQDKLITLCMAPKGMAKEEAEKIVKKFDDCLLFEKETDLLDAFLILIGDADILSGWNSESYDIPYLINRIKLIMGNADAKRFCLWGDSPKLRKFERFGAENITFDIYGRIHLDYMQLYRKNTYHEMHSYSLDAIGEYEVDERKVQYHGTLDQLYNNDFEKFIDYNRQDVLLLDKLDKKLKFIDLTNEVAHDNTVQLPTTMGPVAVTEQAIINEAHLRNMVVPTKKVKRENEDTTAAGAFVATPRKGLHDWIGSIDINSLYPSAIRALNMGNEAIVGQLRQNYTEKYIRDQMHFKKKSFSESWNGIYGSFEYKFVMDQDITNIITIDWEGGRESSEMTGKEIYNMIFLSDNKYILSANGTIFDNSKESVVSSLLERWYVERQSMQKKKAEATTPEDKAFWHKRQHAKKINLNALYGALLNENCRFYDKRIGQSTTLCGRTISKHMSSYTNECITGAYDNNGEAVIYGDTDSCYFSAWPLLKDKVEKGEIEWDKEMCIGLYDQVAEKVNASFPNFMKDAFNCPRDRGELIVCAREMVALKGLFTTKKRYAVLAYEDEGKRLDIDGKEGRVDVKGLDLKRSDTPKVIQNFLREILSGVLHGDGKEKTIENIKEFKRNFGAKDAWEKGTPKRVNNLTKYRKLQSIKGKVTMPGHVKASMNWNNLRKMHSDKFSQEITDGTKVVVCKLKSNPLGYTSVAYPTDESRLPGWFKDLPFDNKLMEQTVIDKKIDNLLKVLNWDVVIDSDISNTFTDLFSFE